MPFFPGIAETGTANAILGQQQIQEARKRRRYDKKAQDRAFLVDLAALGLGGARMGSDIGLSLARQGAEIEQARRQRGFEAEQAELGRSFQRGENLLDRQSAKDIAGMQSSIRLDFNKDLQEASIADAMAAADAGNIPREATTQFATPGSPENIALRQMGRLQAGWPGQAPIPLDAAELRGQTTMGAAETMQKILQATPDQDQDEVVREVLRRMRLDRPEFPDAMDIERELSDLPPPTPSPPEWNQGGTWGNFGGLMDAQANLQRTTENERRAALREAIRNALGKAR